MTTTEVRYIKNKKNKQERLDKEKRLVYRGVAYNPRPCPWLCNGDMG